MSFYLCNKQIFTLTYVNLYDISFTLNQVKVQHHSTGVLYIMCIHWETLFIHHANSMSL